MIIHHSNDMMCCLPAKLLYPVSWCYLVAETEIQITKQRSSSWATNCCLTYTQDCKAGTKLCRFPRCVLFLPLFVAAGLNLISATRHRSSIPRFFLILIIFGEEDPEMNDSNGGVSACLHVCAAPGGVMTMRSAGEPMASRLKHRQR